MNTEVTYRISEQQIQIGAAAYWRKIRRGVGRWYLWVALAGYLLVFAILYLNGATWRDSVPVAGVFILLGVYEHLCFRFLLWQKRAQIKAYETNNPRLLFTEAGFAFLTDSGRADREWSAMRDLIVEDKVVLLIWGKHEFMVIPKDHFPDEVIAFLKQRRSEPPKLAKAH